MTKTRQSTRQVCSIHLVIVRRPCGRRGDCVRAGSGVGARIASPRAGAGFECARCARRPFRAATAGQRGCAGAADDDDAPARSTAATRRCAGAGRGDVASAVGSRSEKRRRWRLAQARRSNPESVVAQQSQRRLDGRDLSDSHCQRSHHAVVQMAIQSERQQSANPAQRRSAAFVRERRDPGPDREARARPFVQHLGRAHAGAGRPLEPQRALVHQLLLVPGIPARPKRPSADRRQIRRERA